MYLTIFYPFLIQRRCLFYIHSEYNYETCGPRRDVRDVPKLIIIRFASNGTEDIEKIEKVEKDPKNYLAAFLAKDIDPTSQLVAHYNGSDEVQQV